MRVIRDDYEMLGRDDDDEPYGSRLRPRRRAPRGLLAVALFVLAVFAAFAGASYVLSREADDNMCGSCHTIPHQTYLQRAQFAQGGSLAADLASFHYQQLRLKGDEMRCIACHRGDGSPAAHADKFALSAANTWLWLSGRDSSATEKQSLRAPSLTNDACVACHQKTLLLAGGENHFHNTLPSAYALWKGGARLIAPQTTQDAQAIFAAGLRHYDTTVTCNSCHTGHKQIESDVFLDQAVVARACAQCHREIGREPP